MVYSEKQRCVWISICELTYAVANIPIERDRIKRLYFTVEELLQHVHEDVSDLLKLLGISNVIYVVSLNASRVSVHHMLLLLQLLL